MKFWEVIGVSVLLGPLITTSVGLFYRFIQTGVREFIMRQVPNSLIINGNENDPEFKKYVEELEKIGKNFVIKKIINFFLIIIKIIVITLILFIVVLAFILLPY